MRNVLNYINFINRVSSIEVQWDIDELSELIDFHFDDNRIPEDEVMYMPERPIRKWLWVGYTSDGKPM